MKVFNTMGREKQDFVPLQDGKVSMYACGPTVYDLPHIGNFRSFFLADMIRRYFEYKGFEVKLVMNITDIDDKTIKRSGEEGQSLKEFTDKYTQVFFDGIDALRIKRATEYPRATECIQEMIDLIQKLLDKGVAYQRDDGIYFSIEKYPEYGKLSKVDLTQIKTGARVCVDEYDKENPQDFALWKFSSQEELSRGIFFETPWGKGRPGWHIECSCMSTKFLGPQFDIHTGGVDLIFPHHENELAQSAAAGDAFAKYWIHGEHLLVNNAKMSKSAGNYFTLTDLLEKYDTDAIRYLFLSTHYRSTLNYSEEAMKSAAENVEKFKNTLRSLHEAFKNPGTNTFDAEKYKEEFEASMDDDFDTPAALRVIHALSKEINTHLDADQKSLSLAKETFEKLLHSLGVLEEFEVSEELSPELMALVKEREECRKRKDWARADFLRQQLMAKGIRIDDTPGGTKWYKI